MAWGNTRIRRAGTADVAELVELTGFARQESPLTSQLCTPDSTHLTELFNGWLGLEGSEVVVAENEGRIVGFALVQQVPPNLFSDIPFIQIEGLFVREEFRRRGIARCILADVVTIAEAANITQIVTIVLTGGRQELRFLAGLGFAPAGARRIVDVHSLNRRLSSPNRERRVRGLDELIARRRRTRDLTTTA